VDERIRHKNIIKAN